MPQATYLFYDIETTGLNHCFDQVVQFAAIRTDLELHELERHEVIIKLNPDCIPSPHATITHRVGIKESASGLSELAAMRTIHPLFNTPNTISLGYNTLGFDDEFLRFSFYRNLLPPYTHQYAQSCGRMDLYPITVLYYLFCPSVIEWPMIEGNVSLKLENLSAANQLATGHAHNAMVDVVATLALAKRLKQETKMWEYVHAYFDKKIDLERMNQLTAAFQHIDRRVKEALLIEGKLGRNSCYQAPVLALGPHQVYKNQSLWLRLDFPNFSAIPPDELVQKAYVIRKRCAEPPLLLPTSERFLKHLSAERIAQTNANKVYLAENPALLQALCDHHQNYTYPNLEGVDLDAALYQRGFPTPMEEQLNRDFHRAHINNKTDLLDAFSNPQQLEQALRILGRHHPELLNDAQRATFTEYLKRCHSNEPLQDYKARPKLSLQMAKAQIKELLVSGKLDGQQMALLEELEAYLSLARAG